MTMKQKKEQQTQMVEWNLEEALKMWNDGKSSSMIARHFGVTRNAAIGKINRARAKGMNVIQKAPYKPKSRYEKPVKRAQVPKLKLPVDKPKSLQIVKDIRMEMTSPSPKGLRIWELNNDMCKYPVHTDSHDTHYFCGEKTDKVYCEKHAQMCYNRDVSKPKRVVIADPKRKFLHYR